MPLPMQSLVAGLLNGGSDATEIQAFLDTMTNWPCPGEDGGISENALACGITANSVTASGASYCPPSCSNFYTLSLQRCPTIFDGVVTEKGLTIQNLVDICDAQNSCHATSW